MAKKKEPHDKHVTLLNCIRRRPILPGRFHPSTFSAVELNFCVRNGNRWDLHAIITVMAKYVIVCFTHSQLHSKYNFRFNCLLI